MTFRRQPSCSFQAALLVGALLCSGCWFVVDDFEDGPSLTQGGSAGAPTAGTGGSPGGAPGGGAAGTTSPGVAGDGGRAGMAGTSTSGTGGVSGGAGSSGNAGTGQGGEAGASCGNGKLDAGETCDGDAITPCNALYGFGSTGKPTCSSDCTTIDASACSRIVQVGVAVSNGCALYSDQHLWCWGSGTSGQLGQGNQLSSTIPVQVQGPVAGQPLDGVTSFSINDRGVCAVQDTKVLCWGEAPQGPGSKGSVSYGDDWRPRYVAGVGQETNATPLSGISQVRAGSGLACAMEQTGKAIYCWGSNKNGRLGANTTATYSNAPVKVLGTYIENDGEIVTELTSILQFDSFSGGGCLLNKESSTEGSVQCWGTLTEGDLNTAQIYGGGFAPTDPGFTYYYGLKIFAGPTTCTIAADATAQCWGANKGGEVGDGTLKQQDIPVPLFRADGTTPLKATTLSLSRGLEAAGSWACALDSEGAPLCWGTTKGKTLGNGTSHADRPTALLSGLGGSTIKKAKDISVAPEHACLINEFDQLLCWGSNSAGELALGQPDTDSHLYPELALGFAPSPP